MPAVNRLNICYLLPHLLIYRLEQVTITCRKARSVRRNTKYRRFSTQNQPLFFGTRNEHGIPLIALKVFGPDGLKEVRGWVESRGRAEGGQSFQLPMLPPVFLDELYFQKTDDYTKGGHHVVPHP